MKITRTSSKIFFVFMVLVQSSYSMSFGETASSTKPTGGMISIESQFSVAQTAERLENIFNKKGVTIFNRVKHSVAAEKIGVSL